MSRPSPQKPKPTTQASKVSAITDSGRLKLAFVLVLILGAVVSGIGYALNLQRQSQETTTGGSQETIITEITVGALLHMEEAGKKNPKISQSPSYKTTDQLVLRVTTAPNITRPVELFARLLTETGEIVDLDPSSVVFQPGTSGFCCWQVEEPGNYTLQIFRPERTITSIPLKIIQGFDTGNVPGFSL